MKAESKKEITFTLDASEALNLFAYLANDESVPFGINEGRRVAMGICDKLANFLGKERWPEKRG